jgi:hypothetical protein
MKSALNKIFLLPMLLDRLTYVVYVFRDSYNRLQTCRNLDVLSVYGV